MHLSGGKRNVWLFEFASRSLNLPSILRRIKFLPDEIPTNQSFIGGIRDRKCLSWLTCEARFCDFYGVFSRPKRKSCASVFERLVGSFLGRFHAGCESSLLS